MTKASLMDIDNITLDFDREGIWLIHETTEKGDRAVIRMGHIHWSIIAMYIKEYL